MLIEEFASEIDEVVDEQYFVDVELVFGEDNGKPVEESRMSGAHDEMVETFH